MPQRTVTALSFAEFPVGVGNFDSNRLPVNMIVLHSEAGYKAGTRALFSTPPELRTGPQANKPSSAHYAVNLDGTLDHYLEEYLNAYHAGNYNINQRSIGIETEDNAAPTTITRPDIQYKTLIALVADICKFYGITPDRDHIKKHNEVMATTCPGNLDIDKVIAGVKVLLGISTPPSPTTTGIATVTANLGVNLRNAASISAPILTKLIKGSAFQVTGSLPGDSVSGNNIWFQTPDGKFVWSGGISITQPPVVIPQGGTGGTPSPVVPQTSPADIQRAGQVVADAIKRPEIASQSGDRFGNAEGAAREMVGAWPSYLNLIKDSKQAKNVVQKAIDALGKAFGV